MVNKNLSERMLGFFYEWFAIDLGTVNTLIYSPRRGIVLNEPSVLAIDKNSGKVINLGHDALSLLGREPADTEIHFPVRDGTIANYEITELMLKEFLRRAGIIKRGKLLQAICSTPNLSTGVEKRALNSVMNNIGAHRVYLIEEGLAAALGTGVLQETRARIIVDIGGGTTNITIASNAGVIYSNSLKIAGNSLNDAVKEHFQRKYRLLISEQDAELIKIQLGNAMSAIISDEQGGNVRRIHWYTPKDLRDDDIDNSRMTVMGKSMSDLNVKSITVSTEEISEALERSIQTIIRGIQDAVERASPNVAIDIHKSGIILTGGCSQLKGLAQRLNQELMLTVTIAESPLESVVLGAGKLVGKDNLLEKYQIQVNLLEIENGKGSTDISYEYLQSPNKRRRN